jgi:20S proteasome alpha/beta subunit
MCETLWRPKMTPDELFECISQAMMSALDRDASSGKLNFSENKYESRNLTVGPVKNMSPGIKGLSGPEFFSQLPIVLDP